MKTLKLFIRVLLIPVWITIFFIYLFIWYIQMSQYYLGKECTIDKGLQGIIVGIEDCNSFCDYYYIVYVPESKQVMYELANSADFVKTIKI